jgi:hypothetical protein
MRKAAINWTSTEVPMWEMDCVQFWRTGLPFELRNVTTEEHEAFVERFASAHQLTVEQYGSTVLFGFDGLSNPAKT